MTGITSKRVKDGADDMQIRIHLQQGVPVLDRDLELLGGLAAEQLRRFSEAAIGDGTAEDGFAIRALPDGENPRDDFVIGAGSFLAGGVGVRNHAAVRYSAQSPPAPPLTTPRSARTDRVYLEVRAEDVDAASDPALANSDDVGVPTSSRVRLTWTVRVAEDGTLPLRELSAGALVCVRVALAEIAREAGAGIEPGMIRDLRSSGFSLASLASRINRIHDAFLPAIATVVSSPDSVAQPYQTNLEIRGRQFYDPENQAPMLEIAGFPIDRTSLQLDPASVRIVAPLPASVPAGEVELHLRSSFGATRHTIALHERWETLNTLASDVGVTFDLDPNGKPNQRPVVITLGITAETGQFRVYNWSWKTGGSGGPSFLATSPIAPSFDGLLWFVRGGQLTNNAPIPPPPVAATDIAVVDPAGAPTADQIVVGRVSGSTVSSLARTPGASWTDFGPKLPEDGAHIAVDPHGVPWVAGVSGNLYVYRGSSWVQTPAPPVRNIAIGGDGVVWILGGDPVRAGVYGIFSLRGTSWLRSDATGVSIAADHNGVPWVVDDLHTVRYRTLEVWPWR